MNDVTVEDGPKNLVIEVTRDDVKKSIKNDPKHCAVAIAVERIFKADEVRIHKTVAYVKKGQSWRRYIVPPAIYRETVSFDRGAQFETGTYYLRAPHESEQLGSSRNVEKDKYRRPYRKAPLKMKTRNVRPDADTQIYSSLA